MSRGPSWFRAHAGRRDKNHAAIRDGLRALGHFVVDCAGLGDGTPDLCVYRSRGDMIRDALNYVALRPEPLTAPPVWLELKVGKGKLRASQVAWRTAAEARGIRVATVRSLDEALAVLGDVVQAEARAT